MRDANGPPPKPEFLWDPVAARLIWADEDGLAFWGEPTVEDLTERYFAPESEIVRAFAALARAVEEADGENEPEGARVLFTHGAKPVLAQVGASAARAADGRALLRVRLEEVEQPGDPATLRIGAGFEAAPRPMAIFAADGAALARNAADRAAFPDGGDRLAQRFAAPAEAAAGVSAALVDGGESRVSTLIARSGKTRWRVTLRRFADPGAGGLAVMAEFVDLSLRPAAPAASVDAPADRQDMGVAAAAPGGFAEAPVAPLIGAPTPETSDDAPAGPMISAASVSQIAHDLRAPLTAIKGFADFMAQKRDEMTAESRAVYLADISEASRRMMALVDQIVALGAAGPAPADDGVADDDANATAADADRGGRHIGSLDLNALAQEAARLIGPRIQMSGDMLDLRLAPNDARAIGDRTAVIRILGNLIDNALTHGRRPGGTAAVLVAVIPPGDRPAEIVIGDTGPGMSADALAQALKPYGAAQPEGRTGGLGLSNAMRLAEATAARLEIETAPGDGLTARLIFSPNTRPA